MPHDRPLDDPTTHESVTPVGPVDDQIPPRVVATTTISVNHRLGRDAVRLASTGFERKWKGKSELQSTPSLTDPERLPKAKDGPKPRIRFHE